MARIWTPANVSFLKKNHVSMTFAQIASHVGSTPMSVQSMASNLGLLKVKRWTKEDRDQLKSLIAEGKTFAEIAKILKTTEASVAKHAQSFGIKVNGKFLTAEVAKYIRSHYKSHSNREIADHLKVPVPIVKSFLHRNELTR